MGRWNDNKLPIPRKKLALFYVGIIVSFVMAGAHYMVYGFLNIENYAAIILSAFLIYCLNFGGGYKLAKYFTERNIRKAEGNWKPKWYK